MDTEKRVGPSPTLTRRNRIAGFVLLLVGTFVTIEAFGYGLGQISRLGPGALPFGLGILIAIFGLLIATVNPDGADEVPAIKWRPVAMILGALLAFALLVEPAGLVIATGALVFISGVADPEHTWRSLLAIYLVLIVFVYVVFVQLLAVPFSMFGG